MSERFAVKDIAKLAKEGILTNNPILIQVLGLCPTLAVTASVQNGLGMGISVAAVLLFSNLLVSLLRKIIPKQIRIASYVVIIAGLATVAEMLLKAYIPSLSKSLGLFVPLIVVNCIVLARAEAFASKNGPVSSLLDGLFMGLGFTAALFLLSAAREITGSGTFFGIHIFPPEFAAGMFVSPPGAFISLGILIAAFKKATAFAGRKMKKAKEEK
ncbi:MAG: electron transport complex subunit E [Oscillospiraceae bacterium]|nr:electron transport complex subunit E [Oscillospiraceae bacterium]